MSEQTVLVYLVYFLDQPHATDLIDLTGVDNATILNLLSNDTRILLDSQEISLEATRSYDSY